MVQRLNQILHNIDTLQCYLLIVDSSGAIGAAITGERPCIKLSMAYQRYQSYRLSPGVRIN